MSFYRTYRPQTIGEIDNAKVADLLLSLVHKEKGSLPHAFLFTGPKGTGKTTAARLIAKIYNCLTPNAKNGPCGTCHQCISIASGTNLDVLEIDAASNRGIDEMRQLRDSIALTPSQSAYKVYIIDEVHMLTTEAFNALLKTLEEPPHHAIFILATTDPHKVPPTVVSRCIVVTVGKAQKQELLTALTRIVKREKMVIDDTALALIARVSDGSFRDAVKLLEQVKLSGDSVTAETVEKMLSLSTDQVVETFLHALLDADIHSAITIITDLIKNGSDIKSFLLSSLQTLSDRLVELVENKSTDLTFILRVKNAIRALSQAYAEMKGTAIAELPIELAVVEFCMENPSQKNILPKPDLQSSPAKVDEGKETGHESSSLPGLLTIEKLTEFWRDFIEEMKSYNNSIAGVLRSTRPKEVDHGIVRIEAFYPFHQEKLSETKTRDTLALVLKKLFGEKVQVEVILGKK